MYAKRSKFCWIFSKMRCYGQINNTIKAVADDFNCIQNIEVAIQMNRMIVK